MNAQLINLGFVQVSNVRYVNYEYNFYVELQEDGTVSVETPQGMVSSTLEELEEVLVLGGFDV